MKSRVLVVEDDANLSTLLRENLTFEGFDVRVVGDGVQAVEEARAFLPDLVVLDIMLPGMNGFELCGTLRRNGRTPVLIVSARSDKNDKVRGLNLGADDYITKPFELEEFLARVHAVLRGLPGRPPKFCRWVRFGSTSGRTRPIVGTRRSISPIVSSTC
jgi:DNA-binding response OmpR family regulator